MSEDLRAELVPAGALKISGLLFGTLEKGSFEPRLHFSNEEAAVGYMEINNVPKGAEVTANLELTLSGDDQAKVTFPMQTKNGANEGADASPDRRHAEHARFCEERRPTPRPFSAS